MKRFFCLTLFVACLFCFGACTMEVGTEEVVKVFDSVWEKVRPYWETCWAYIMKGVEVIKAQF